MALAPSICLVLTATKLEQELVVPAKPTPKESKEFSDVDDQKGLRFHFPIIQFYGSHPAMKGRDPVKVIRDAVAETLVHFYPFAGRLRERPDGKLIVDCTGEGILFIEADADVKLDQFGDALHPPFPCLDQLVCDLPTEFLNSPLLLIQVTRLMCGGFIFTMQFNHAMCDGAGLAKFTKAVGEMARGAHVPSVPPVWQRDLLNARIPPRITCIHHEYDPSANTKDPFAHHQDMMLVRHSFFFGPTSISTLRRLVPPHLSPCSTFELITACMWRSRTIALQFDPDEQVSFGFLVDAQAKYNPPLSSGYYGNAIVSPGVMTTAGNLCQNSLGYALELVTKIKKEVTHEYMKSLADLIVLRGRKPQFKPPNAFQLSDVTRAGFEGADFGWGEATYGGPAIALTSWMSGFYTRYKNESGEIGFVVPICLPAPAMKRFLTQLNIIFKHPHQVIKSTL